MSRLFQPIEIGSLTLPNRIVIAPMCQYSADEGRATDWHLIHLGNLALSGASLLIIEATAVSPEGRISPADLGLWSDATEAALAGVVRSIRKWSPVKLGLQLAHAGRKSSTRPPWEGGNQIRVAEGGWRTLAPSAVAFAAHDDAPEALDAVGLERVRQEFASAARRAVAIGLDLIEIHAAHGYLLHQFLSPLSNRRQDAYGGSLENRIRFPLEMFEAVRTAVPRTVPVGVRISATDWAEGGWTIDESVAFAEALEARGCAFIHVSSGGLTPAQKIPAEPNYQVGFAARIKRETGMPTVAVGLITDPAQAEAIVEKGEADLVALARGVLYDPRWPWHAAAELGAEVWAPRQYLRAQPRALARLFVPD
jgi:2,4-dienoyl-CoA reductase-like NADH-dependent reductase (Old Yellow Enzyme family)